MVTNFSRLGPIRFLAAFVLSIVGHNLPAAAQDFSEFISIAPQTAYQQMYMAVNPTTNRVYFLAIYQDSPVIDVLDGSTNTIIATISIPPENGPTSFLAVNANSNRIYTVFGGRHLAIFDGNTNTFIKSVPFPEDVTFNSSASRFVINPNNNRIFFSTYIADGDNPTYGVTVFDGDTETFLPQTNVPVVEMNDVIALNPSTNRLYVAAHLPDPDRTVIAVLDGNTAAPITTILTPSTICSRLYIAANPNTNKIFGQFNNACAGPLNDIYVFDGTTNTFEGTIPLPEGIWPYSDSAVTDDRALSVNPTTNRIYTMNDPVGIAAIDGNTKTYVSFSPLPVLGLFGDYGNPFTTINPVTNRLYQLCGPSDVTHTHGICVYQLGTVETHQLTGLDSARVWVGLKNSDDVGTKFDLRAEVFKNGALIGFGQLNDVLSGSSGFNNARQDVISLALSQATGVSSGDTLSLRLSVRIAASSGHRSGTARLWFNDSAANSGFVGIIDGATNNYSLQNGFSLSNIAGPGPKKSIDVLVDRAVGGNQFKPFGTWSVTF